MNKLLFLLIIVLISGCTTGNITKEGPYIVTKVVDGDTLDLDNGQRIRFSGINTPETGECYYQEAKDRLKELILNKEVYTERDKSDKGAYGRYLRYLYLDDMMINEEIVKEGYAKVYDKYKDDTKRYDQLKEAEAIAKSQNLGVWSCEDPKEGCAYVASKNSKVYYKPDCKYAKKIKPENLLCFKSKAEIPDGLTLSTSC
ncbi:MAG: thermonuclease family protein [archaeon]